MFKSANIGTTDRLLRLLAGIALAVYASTSLIGTGAIVAYGIAAVLILTALLRFCPAYRLLGISTCKISR